MGEGAPIRTTTVHRSCLAAYQDIAARLDVAMGNEVPGFDYDIRPIDIPPRHPNLSKEQLAEFVVVELRGDGDWRRFWPIANRVALILHPIVLGGQELPKRDNIEADVETAILEGLEYVLTEQRLR